MYSTWELRLRQVVNNKLLEGQPHSVRSSIPNLQLVRFGRYHPFTMTKNATSRCLDIMYLSEITLGMLYQLQSDRELVGIEPKYSILKRYLNSHSYISQKALKCPIYLMPIL